MAFADWSPRLTTVGATGIELSAISASYQSMSSEGQAALDTLVAGIANADLLQMLQNWRQNPGPFLALFPGGGLPVGISWIGALYATAARQGSGVQSVGSSTVVVATAYATRNSLEIYNDDPSTVVYGALGEAAVLSRGFRINPNGGRWATPDNTGGVVYTGAVQLIAASTVNVTFIDV